MTKLLVAGERPPGREKFPFTNRAGKNFREAMQRARIKPERALFFYPLDLDELLLTIGGESAEFVILSGDKMLQLVQPDLRTAQCHGRVMGLDDGPDPVLMFPVFHHEAFVRMPKQFGPILDDELALLRHIASHKDQWTKFVADTCVKCRAPRYRVTPQRVVYCQQHWIRPAA